MNDEMPPVETSHYWDAVAATFDDEPDHGLQDPMVIQVWTELLKRWLPETPIDVLDIGCGTGSLSVVMAELGHKVTGIDLSPEMIRIANQKADSKSLDIQFQVMDARKPTLPSKKFDGIVCRHLLWLMPDLAATLKDWSYLIRLPGRVLLVEGYWAGGGLHSEQVVAAMPNEFTHIAVEELSNNEAYWGKVVKDERYAVTALLEI